MKTTKRDSKKSLSQTGGHRVVAGTKSSSRKASPSPSEAARAMVDALEAILRAERRGTV